VNKAARFFERADYPFKYFLLDIIGCAFVIPSALKMAGNIDIIPALVQFEHYEWWLLGLTMIFAAPGIVFSIKKVNKLRKQEAKNLSNK